jgi:[acyl-carrier-protein] S-malonyltransferase
MGTGVVFAGQGAQFVGMGKDLAASSSGCKALFETADSVLGYSLSTICFEGPEAELTKSNHCQPAIFVASMACYTALKEKKPDLAVDAAAGLSLGEWSALHMAGALSFEDTLKVLEARGRFMQEACEERDGAMLSVIGLNETQCREIALKAGVEVANLNSDAQTVLSGERAGILQAETFANEAGAKRAIVLNVAGAFHSSLMQSAADRLAAVLDEVEIKAPHVPVVANVTGQPHGGPDEIRQCMLRQITESVRWLDCVQWFPSNGVNTLVECGPGKVLAGLIKRIDRTLDVSSIQDDASLAAFTAG